MRNWSRQAGTFDLVGFGIKSRSGKMRMVLASFTGQRDGSRPAAAQGFLHPTTPHTGLHGILPRPPDGRNQRMDYRDVEEHIHQDSNACHVAQWIEYGASGLDNGPSVGISDQVGNAPVIRCIEDPRTWITAVSLRCIP